jgi:predicted MFS family arabinose efflux permease
VTESAAAQPHHVQRSIKFLGAAAFASGANLRIADPLIPTLAHDFSVGVASAARVVTAFTLAYGLFQLVSGPIADRLGKLRTVSIALLIAAIASMGSYFVTSLSALTALRFATGIGAGAIIPLALAYIGDNVPYHARQLALGRFMGAVLLGQAFGPVFGGLLSEHTGWRQVFLLMGFVFLAVAVPLFAESRQPVHASTSGPHVNPLVRYRELLRDRWVRVMLLTVCIEGFLFYGALAYLGAYLKQRFGLGYGLIGLVLAGFSIGGVIYSVSVRTLVRRLGEQGLVRGGGVLLALCYAGIVLVPAWQLTVPFFVLLGLSFYMLHNTLQTKATEMAPHARGSAISIFAFSLFLGQAAGVWSLGLGIESAGFELVIGGAGVALMVLAVWFRTQLAAHARRAVANP